MVNISRIKMLALAGLVVLTSACEGIVGADGYVYDSRTNLPLKDVKVVMLLNNFRRDSCYSNDKGYFTGSEFVGCVPSCPDAKLVLTKEGFKELVIDFNEYWDKNEYNRDSITLHLSPMQRNPSKNLSNSLK